eukprot:365630-Chlamydomonas_euryale.AAC.36
MLVSARAFPACVWVGEREGSGRTVAYVDGWTGGWVGGRTGRWQGGQVSRRLGCEGMPRAKSMQASLFPACWGAGGSGRAPC